MYPRNKQMFGKRYRKHRAWDLFSYMAKDISVDLKAFIKYNLNGVPSAFVSDPNNCNDDDMQRWHDTVKKMWWSFDQIARDYPDRPWNIAWNKYWKEIGQYVESWTEKDENGNTYYKSDDRFIPPAKEEDEAYEIKLKEGLHLFAEYFQDLWD